MLHMMRFHTDVDHMNQSRDTVGISQSGQCRREGEGHEPQVFERFPCLCDRLAIVIVHQKGLKLPNRWLSDGHNLWLIYGLYMDNLLIIWIWLIWPLVMTFTVCDRKFVSFPWKMHGDLTHSFLSTFNQRVVLLPSGKLTKLWKFTIFNRVNQSTINGPSSIANC